MVVHNKGTTGFRARDRLGRLFPTLIGASSVVLMPEVPTDGIIERVIHNPSASASLAVSLSPPSVAPALDETAPGAPTPAGQPSAALNLGGSITIPPLGTLYLEHTGAIQGIGASANSPITCYER